MDQVWRALFDRLYMRIGSVIEKSEHAGNLNYLIALVMSDAGINQETRKELDDAFARLGKFDDFRTWRNKTIAHNDLEFDATAFYETHKQHVSGYQPVIDELYEVLNIVSLHSIETIHLKPDKSARQRLMVEAGDLYHNQEI